MEITEDRFMPESGRNDFSLNGENVHKITLLGKVKPMAMRKPWQNSASLIQDRGRKQYL